MSMTKGAENTKMPDRMCAKPLKLPPVAAAMMLSSSEIIMRYGAISP